MTSSDTQAHRSQRATTHPTKWYGRSLAVAIVVVALATTSPPARAGSDQPPAVVGTLRTWEGIPGMQTNDGALLGSTPWKLVEGVGADGAAQPVLPGTEITATFQAGRLFGSAGCNNYTGGYAVTGNAISIEGPAGTLRLCVEPQGIMEQEIAYLAALQRTGRFDVAPDALILRDPAGAMLLRFAPQPQTPLEGTNWTAQDYNNGRNAVVGLHAGTEITARFERGRIVGSAGCNAYTAPYTLSGNAIEIGPSISTRRFCMAPQGIMEQEAAYLAALETARVYRIDGNRLTLTTADGARVAGFVPMSGAQAPDADPLAARPQRGKVTFDLAAIDDTGLTGPPSGRVAVAYEFCVPAARLAEVQRLDPTVRAYPGSPGRRGCRVGEEVLCIGSTHQPEWQAVLQALASLDYVAHIDRHFDE